MAKEPVKIFSCGTSYQSRELPRKAPLAHPKDSNNVEGQVENRQVVARHYGFFIALRCSEKWNGRYQ